MFGFLARWFLHRRDAAARAEEAASKAWLDDLRQNELSMNARRRIAPEEPVKAPGVAHGSAEAATDVDRLVAGFSRQAPERKQARPGCAEDGGVSGAAGAGSASTAGEPGGEAGGAFGGAGGDGSFGGADAGAASGDSADTG